MPQYRLPQRNWRVMRFVELPMAQRVLRILIEIEEQDSADALAAAHAIIALLDKAGLAMPRQLHGFDASQWPLHDEAVRLGYQRRIGLEDGRMMPDGSMAIGNAQMVSAATKAALLR